jgi:hypothetical protein
MCQNGNQTAKERFYYIKRHKGFLLALLLGGILVFSVMALITYQIGLDLGAITLFSRFLLNWNLWLRGPSVYVLVLYVYLWAWLPLFFILLRNRLKKSVTYTEVFGSVRIETINKNMVLILVLLLVVFLRLYPYLRNTHPIGIDTPYYILNLRLAESNPSLALSGNFIWHFASYEITFFPLSLLRFGNLSWEAIIVIFQVFSAVIYILTTYWFMKQYTSDTIALISVIFVALSFSTQNLAGIYYRNVIGLSLMIAFFAFFLRSFKSRNRIELALSSLCIILLSLQYQALVLQLVLILCVFFLITALSRDLELPIGRLTRNTLIVFIPILLLFTVATSVIFLKTGITQGNIFEYPLYEFNKVFALSLNNFLPTSWIAVFTGQWDSNFVENPLILLLSLAGVLALTILPVDKERKLFRNFLISWFISTSLIFMLTDPQGEVYRMVLNFPFGLTAAFGLVIFSKLRVKLKVSSAVSRSKTD